MYIHVQCTLVLFFTVQAVYLVCSALPNTADLLHHSAVHVRRLLWIQHDASILRLQPEDQEFGGQN